MPFYIFAWIGAISSGFNVLTTKLTSKHAIANPWLFNILLALVTLLFTIPPAIIYHAGMPNLWWPIVLAALFSTLFNLFWIFSTYALDVSTLAPLFNFRSIFALLIGTIFLKEVLTIQQLFFVFIILVAGVFS